MDRTFVGRDDQVELHGAETPPDCFALRAFAEVGYAGGVDPDHTPGISDDTKETQMGWAYAVGQLRALRLAAYA